MYLKTHVVSITTDTNGDGTGYTPPVKGRILQIRYVKTDFADGASYTVTLETSGAAVWSESAVNASATRLPRQATHNTSGSAVSYSNGYPVLEPIYCADERVKIVIASGGSVKSGTFYVTVG